MYKVRCIVALLSVACCGSVFAANDSDRQSYYAALSADNTLHFLSYTIPTWAIFLNFLTALTLFVVWRKQRAESLFTWLLVSTLVASGDYIHIILRSSLAPWLSDCLFVTWCYCLVRVLFARPRFPQNQRLLYLSLACLSAFVTAPILSTQAHEYFRVVVFGSLVITAIYRIFNDKEDHLKTPVALVLGIFSVAIAGLVDSAFRASNLQLLLISEQVFVLIPMAHMLSNFLILCFLVSFYAQNRKDLHSLNLSLDQRVQQAAQELETRYQHIKHDSIEAAAIHERSRIFQSIHEDLGDKLLQLVYLAKSNATADLARAALAELRDSRNLNPDHNRVLDEVLADAFAETQSRCEPVQLTLKWDTQDSTQGIILNARQESVLTRTLREAISNIIKHASATTISLTFSCSSNAHRVLKYRILDDGVGIANDYVAGRGLVNMHQRMKELNGTLEVSRASPYGTLLLFQLPVMQGSI